MRTVLGAGPTPWRDLMAGLAGAVASLGLALLFCAWMLRVFRQRGFVIRCS